MADYSALKQQTGTAGTSFDREKANQALARYDSKKYPALDSEGVESLRSVTNAAREKVMEIVNASPELKRDFPIFKDWLKKNESSLARGSFATFQKAGVIQERGAEQAATATPEGKLLVSPTMSRLIQWRFAILDAEHSLDEVGKGAPEATKTFRERFQVLAPLLAPSSSQPGASNQAGKAQNAQAKP